MGQTLSEPVKDKHSSLEFNNRIICASSSMQGWRISMEDAHTALLTLPPNGSDYAFFGVYDGHGGQNVARYSGAHLHEKIMSDPSFRQNTRSAIERAFLGTDEDLKNDPNFENDPSGCTAVIALVAPDGLIYVGNAGDSRAVISQAGVAKEMSIDHKPINPGESSRIVKAGGFIEFGRVNGNLALSRALGDFEFKANGNLKPEEQIVTAFPEIMDCKIDPETEFIVLACDGIWDCLSSQDVVAFLRKEISKGCDLKVACENLMDRCLARDSELGGIGCDNMTVIVAGFLHNKSVPEWYEWVKDRVNKGIGPPLKEETGVPSSAGSDNYPLGDDDDLDISAPMDIERFPAFDRQELAALDRQDDSPDPARVNVANPTMGLDHNIALNFGRLPNPARPNDIRDQPTLNPTRPSDARDHIISPPTNLPPRPAGQNDPLVRTNNTQDSDGHRGDANQQVADDRPRPIAQNPDTRPSTNNQN